MSVKPKHARAAGQGQGRARITEPQTQPARPPLELDLDMLRERHLFPQDCPQLGVERGGVEGAGVVALMGLVAIPVRQFLDPPAGQARLRCWRAVLVERVPLVRHRYPRPAIGGGSSDFDLALRTSLRLPSFQVVVFKGFSGFQRGSVEAGLEVEAWSESRSSGRRRSGDRAAA